MRTVTYNYIDKYKYLQQPIDCTLTVVALDFSLDTTQTQVLGALAQTPETNLKECNFHQT